MEMVSSSWRNKSLGSEYEVLEGLEEGAAVVVKGQAALKDGVKVNVL